MSADDEHPLAGGGGSSTIPRASFSSPAPPQSVTSSISPLPAGVPIDYESASDDDETDPRQKIDPYAATMFHLSAANEGGAAAAPRPTKSEITDRVAEFWRAFEAKESNGVIDEGIVRRYVFDYGAPEQPSGMRALLWRLLLGYLPWDRKEWKNSMKTQRATYQTFVNELTANPFADMDPLGGGPVSKSTPPSSSSSASTASNSSASSSAKTVLKFEKISSFDDPLSTKSSNNEWSKYYKDNSIREEIEKDVRRTYSTFHFFNERVQPIESSAEEIKKLDQLERIKQAEQEEIARRGNAIKNLFEEDTIKTLASKKDGAVPSIAKVEVALQQTRKATDETHHDVIKRILFIFAKLNPGIRYVQGMNEILAPVYYTFYRGTNLRKVNRATGELEADPDNLNELFDDDHAEADAFACFTLIMSQMRDRFIKSLDLSPTGIISVIEHLNNLLKSIDYQLWAHLAAEKVDPRFYSFRWLTLMLSQELDLPDTIRLWDSLFAAEPEASRESTDKIGVKPPSAADSKGEDDSTNKKLIVEFLNDVCCALLTMHRRALLEADFSVALKMLQSAGQGMDVQRLLQRAIEVRKIRRAQGGFQQLQYKPAPPPLTQKEMQQDFRQPTSRPGEAPPAPSQVMHIALNAKTPIRTTIPVAQPVHQHPHHGHGHGHHAATVSAGAHNNQHGSGEVIPVKELNVPDLAPLVVTAKPATENSPSEAQ